MSLLLKISSCVIISFENNFKCQMLCRDIKLKFHCNYRLNFMLPKSPKVLHFELKSFVFESVVKVDVYYNLLSC